METLFLTVLVGLAWTSWIWPIIFVDNLIKCIKQLMCGQDAGEDESTFDKRAWLVKFSLICMVVPQFLIALMS